MKSFAGFALAILSVMSLAHAHMEMTYPPPLRSKFNPFTKDQDYDIKSPLESSGANFPCRGALKLLNTPQGQAVVNWNASQKQKMTIAGGAAHGGGSCQASLSSDGGKTWRVIHSIVGKCPTQGESSFEFTVPADTPGGKKIFAWSWFNKVGNREMYMNCAVVNIIPVCASRKVDKPAVPFESRPDMFVANVGNRCSTTEGKDLLFPDPGPDVDMNSNNVQPASGQGCAARA
ncbi:hypothetical protein HIM_05270 [Hirsutella minnesotensis 3608]|uniref:Lytic polysaccharide monooxygenase n=1 Tax=Hirsutella minnesotensis 3608 TaxID=1043627 RepID=A0A0F8A5H6_9HYPO|nr:hypothetical protein HIM_05270 [Hirsutella minnesotensis 3608]